MWLECPVAVCCCFEKIPFWKENNAPDIWGKLKFTKLRDDTIFRVFVTVDQVTQTQFFLLLQMLLQALDLETCSVSTRV